MGKDNEAEEASREALAIERNRFGDDSQEVAESLHGLANSFREAASIAEAEEAFREALAIERKLFGDESKEVAATLHDLAWHALCRPGQARRGRGSHARGLGDPTHCLGNESGEVADTLSTWGRCCTTTR